MFERTRKPGHAGSAARRLTQMERSNVIGGLPDAGAAWRSRIDALKAQAPPPRGAWYAYDTLGNLERISALLGDRSLAELAGGHPLIDIGAGDGDLAFFLESLGYNVHAVDHPGTNANCMTGIARLKAALRSSVEVSAIDLEGPFELPAHRYGLGLCFGVLYHLKNPYHVLETLAGRIGHLMLSTRIAQRDPGGGCEFRDLPMAYLVGPDELNRDLTNYWIFSEAGLKRLLDRTGWELLSYFSAGCTEGSDPVRPEADERAFCLARSRNPDPGWSLMLVSGWHDLEDESWRWTARRFSVRVHLTRAARLRRVELNFAFPSEQFSRIGTIRLGARVNGVALAPCVFNRPGEHTYAALVPAEIPAAEDIDIEFELDNAYPPTGRDLRELGVLVVFERKGSTPSAPFRLVFA